MAKKWNIGLYKQRNLSSFHFGAFGASAVYFRYLGADDAAGPNYTGQAAVNWHYDQLEV